MAKLPPRYVNIPAEIIYCKDLSPKIRDTYIQLRGLAYQSHYQETPPLSFKELAEIMGKSASTVYLHVQLLGAQSWLRFRVAEGSAYIFSFPDAAQVSEDSESNPQVSENSEIPINLVSDDLNPLINPDKKKGDIPKNTKSTSTTLRAEPGMRDPALSHPAVMLYRTMTHVTASAFQRAEIVKTVQDAELWRATLEHWLGHGWRPNNVAGMLDSYRSGGRAGCINCNRTARSQSSQGKATPADVEALFRRLKNGSTG